MQLQGSEEVTYSLALKFFWALMWRGFLAAFAVGFVAGFIIGVFNAFTGSAISESASGVVGFVLGMAAYFFVVKHILDKGFKGYRVFLVKTG
jgi:hypothetical protein